MDKLYVGEHCMPCKMTKDWLQENNIEVEIIPGMQHIEEAKALGIRSFPTLVLEKDNQLVQGFENIKEYYGEDNYE